MANDIKQLEKISKLLRYSILVSTTEAGSGHPTSSLSAVELMSVLMFGGFFKYFTDNPDHPNNDRLIFSKGHASPLLYSLWSIAGAVKPEELMTLRKFNGRLEGHPTSKFPYAEAATGSLGQGLSIGNGMAINAKYLDKLPYQTYVLIGDGETEEGQIWEAANLASHYKLDNLTAIVDVNRLEQVGETIAGWNIESYKKKFQAFGWEVIVIEDGHNLTQITDAFKLRQTITEAPVAIIAKTVKGKGVSFLENKEGLHGKALSRDELDKAIRELGQVDFTIKEELDKPDDKKPKLESPKGLEELNYDPNLKISTRKAYGDALVRINNKYPEMVVLDGGTQNSTYSETFEKAVPEKFFPMYIAEQNMVGTAIGLSSRGKLPFVSTFAAFFSRAFDQIRMSVYSNPNIKFAGSHSGVSIGEDGPSQMGLEDIAMFRTLLDGVVLYPSDGFSTQKLVEEAAAYQGNVYIRTTRMDFPIIYSNSDRFRIGGSKILQESVYDVFTVVGAGVTLHEALKAYEELKKENISIRVIDLYSIKPIDTDTLRKSIRETKGLLVVEDHYAEGGIGEAVRSALENSKTKIYSLAVRKTPMSGKPAELLDYEEISSKAIVQKIKEIINQP